MSENNEKSVTEKVAENITATRPEVKPNAEGNIVMSATQLKELMNAAVTGAAEILAKALVESKKPYVDPKQLENDKNMRESMRKVQERMNENIKASQANCPHLQGCNDLSEFPGQLSSIAMHRLDTGEVIGICTNCLRIFRPNDVDYRKEMSRKHGNRMSSSGLRFFADPLAAQLAGH